MAKQNSHWFFILGWALILTIGLFFMGFFIFRSNTNQGAYGMANSIVVNGEGKISVAPDTLIINVSVSELADTTEQAQLQNNKKVGELKAILSKMNVPEKDIKTTSVNVYEEFDRSDTSGKKSLGFRSQHYLNILLSGDNFWELWGQIMDNIAKIWGVIINGTQFELKDKNAALAIAREDALEDAKTKAEQLAKASGRKLGKVIIITDNSYYNIQWPMNYTMARKESLWWGFDVDSVSVQSLNPGETEVIININVMYKIK